MDTTCKCPPKRTQSLACFMFIEMVTVTVSDRSCTESIKKYDKQLQLL